MAILFFLVAIFPLNRDAGKMSAIFSCQTHHGITRHMYLSLSLDMEHTGVFGSVFLLG